MAPRDDDKAMDGLLRRSLAHDAEAADICPEPDILAAYCARSLEPDEIARYEVHFSQCARCREQLTAIYRAEGVMETPVVQEVVEAAAAAPRTMALSSAASDAPKKPAPPRILDWRWLAPVAATILLVVFIYGQKAAHFGKPQSSGNQVAMTKPEAVPPTELTDRKSSALRQVTPLPAPPEPEPKSRETTQPAGPPPVARKLPLMARNYPAAPPTQDKEAIQVDQLRSESESRNDLKKRAEAATATATEKQVPSEMDTFSAAKRNADLPPAKSAPTAGPTPGAAPSTEIETKAGTRGAAAGQKSLVGGMATNKKQMQPAPNINGTSSVTVTSQAVDVQSAVPVIQTPKAGVQYRSPSAGVIERSDDGGATWQGQFVKSNAEILAGAAPSEEVCWFVGRGGIILLTTDGQKWKRISPPVAADLVAVTAADATFATVTAADGRKFSTQDGGRTWHLMK